MPRKPIRFVVGWDGELRELFSVKEKGNQGLNIVVATGTPVGDFTWRTTELRYSIHPSNHAEHGGFEIHETALFSNGDRSDEYASVKPSNSAAMLPFSAVIPASPWLLPSIEGKQLAGFVPVFWEVPDLTLFYVLVASRTPVDDAHFPPGLSVKRVPFSRYTLFVCSGFFNAPSSSITFVSTRTSKLARVNNEEVQDARFPLTYDPVSPEPHQLSYLIEESVDLIAEQMKTKVEGIKFYSGEPTPEKIAALKAGYDTYFSDPYGTRVTHRPLARAHRLAHPPSGLWLPPDGPAGAPPLPGLPHKAPGR